MIFGDPSGLLPNFKFCTEARLEVEEQMHAIYKPQWQHEHRFDEGSPMGERNKKWAVTLTTIMMVAEIVAGFRFNSMALLQSQTHPL